MTVEEIVARYWDALGSEEMTAQTQGALVRFALRLAVQDAYAAGNDQNEFLKSVIASQLERMQAMQAQQAPDQRQAEVDRTQISTLNEWLSNEEPALYHDPYTDTAQAMIAAIRKRDTQIAELQQEIAKVDADNSGLLLRLQKAEQGWAAAQADADRLALQVAQQLAAHVNGGSMAPERPAPAATWFANLDDETNDWRISLEAGRRTFRQVPKASRLLLAQAVARNIGRGALPMQQEFDAHKPDWMPGGGGLAKSFGIVWSELLTVTTFEVAP